MRGFRHDTQLGGRFKIYIYYCFMTLTQFGFTLLCLGPSSLKHQPFFPILEVPQWHLLAKGAAQVRVPCRSRCRVGSILMVRLWPLSLHTGPRLWALRVQAGGLPTFVTGSPQRKGIIRQPGLCSSSERLFCWLQLTVPPVHPSRHLTPHFFLCGSLGLLT